MAQSIVLGVMVVAIVALVVVAARRGWLTNDSSDRDVEMARGHARGADHVPNDTP